jgi:hypothetical protein
VPLLFLSCSSLGLGNAVDEVDTIPSYSSGHVPPEERYLNEDDVLDMQSYADIQAFPS